ncbi:MAG TPA: hypothetical protein VI383_07430 [Gemmatimonadales bacterium]|nr:hypothetical protein [Gemmatimonadales bacterium]
MDTVLSSLTSVSGTVWRVAVLCFLVINGAAVAAILITRSRRLVDTWTPRLVALDAILIGAGLGVPLITGMLRVGLRTIAGMGAGATALLK